MKNIPFLFLLMFFSYGALALPGTNYAIKYLPKMEVYPKVCLQKIYDGPNHNFQLYVFCDDAIGTTIGIIQPNISNDCVHVQGLREVRGDAETKRFWQDPAWARNVEYIRWSQDGLKLEVKTNPIYGTGKTYVLDLCKRTSDPLGASSHEKNALYKY